MAQNQVKRIAYVSVLLFYFMLLSLSVSGSDLSDQNNLPAQNVKKEENQLAAIHEVYSILNSIKGKDYLNDTYFNGSEIQIYDEDNYYLIGMQGKEFYTYLLYDKKEKIVTDLGMQNEVIMWDEEKNIYTQNDEITFYCSGQKTSNDAPIDFPYRLNYDVSKKTFVKNQEELFYGSNMDKKWRKSYRIGSVNSDSTWAIKKLEQKADSLSIYFDRLDKSPRAEYDYPEIRMETELNGRVTLWIKNCKKPLMDLEKIDTPVISDLKTEEYQKENNESGLLISFQVIPNYFLYGEIKEQGYPEPITFSIKKGFKGGNLAKLPVSNIQQIQEKTKYKDASKFIMLQEVYDILKIHMETVGEYHDSGESEKWFILNQPKYYLIGVNGSFSLMNYYIYDKETQEFTHLKLSSGQTDWGKICSATRSGRTDEIIFPFSGYRRIEMGDIPSTVVYNLKLKTYTKFFDIISGDCKAHFWDNRYPHAESEWKIEKIEKEDDKISFYFELIEEVNAIDLYYPEIHLESDENNHVTIWIKNCNITQDQVRQIKLKGISNFRIEHNVRKGKNYGTALLFDILPEYYLFGELDKDYMPLKRKKYLTFYIQKSMEMQRPYKNRKDA